MKKTSRFLSVFLAVVLAFALAIPAFADGLEPVTLEKSGCTYTVAPIGTARYLDENGEVLDEYGYEGIAVFDQAVTFMPVAGGRFYDIFGVETSGIPARPSLNKDGTATLPADAEGICSFCFGTDPSYDLDGSISFAEVYFFEACSKSFLDREIADGAKLKFFPNNDPGTPSIPATVKPAPGTSVMIAGGEFAYTVKSGDSLIKIAAYYYGNADVYKLIYERNKGSMKNADAVYAGQTIILPSYAAVAQGMASTAPAQPAAPGTPSAGKPAPGVSVMIEGGEFLYTVKSGDSLRGLAAYYYGNAEVYKLIHQRNKDVIKNADMIYAGQTIILPSYAAVAQGTARI